jgi:hypothetical protein
MDSATGYKFPAIDAERFVLTGSGVLIKWELGSESRLSTTQPRKRKVKGCQWSCRPHEWSSPVEIAMQ